MARKKKIDEIQEIEEVKVEESPVKEEEIEEDVKNVEENKQMEVYNCYRLRVRKQPSLTSDVIEEKNCGEKVDVLEDLGDFVKVPNGYMLKAFLK